MTIITIITQLYYTAEYTADYKADNYYYYYYYLLQKTKYY